MTRAALFFAAFSIACGGASQQSTEATSHVAAKPAPPPPAPVTLEIVRRPPVGTRWHEIRTYARDQDAPMPPAVFAHHYRDEFEADVAIVEQTAEREVEELVVVRHDSIVDKRAYPGVQKPGARIRIEHTTTGCRATDASSASLDRDERERIFSHLFDCPLQAPTDNDDDFFDTRTPHRVGETWSMSRAMIRKMLEVADVRITRADVTLAAHDKGFALTATYAVVAMGSSGTFRMVVPANPDLPLLETDTDIVREIHERLRRTTRRTMR